MHVVVRVLLVVLVVGLAGFVYLTYRVNDGDTREAHHRAAMKYGLRNVRLGQEALLRTEGRYARNLSSLGLEDDFGANGLGVVVELSLSRDSMSWSARATHVALDSSDFCLVHGPADATVLEAELPDCSWDPGADGASLNAR